MHPVQIFVFHYFVACFAFDPSFVAILHPDGSATHKSITRCSLAKVTSEYFYTRFKITSPLHPLLVASVHQPSSRAFEMLSVRQLIPVAVVTADGKT